MKSPGLLFVKLVTGDSEAFHQVPRVATNSSIQFPQPKRSPTKIQSTDVIISIFMGDQLHHNLESIFFSILGFNFHYP